MAIYFYSTSDQYGALSNFSPHGIEMDGLWWPTVEHYFQSRKFTDGAYQERVRAARGPMQAKKLGGSRKLPIRPHWEEVKDGVMLEACLQKFRTHEEPRELLLSTGDEELVEDAPNDYYWGRGQSGTGQNKLGLILMRVREELRKRP